MRNEYMSQDRAFDWRGIDRVRLRAVLDEVADDDLSDDEVAEMIQTHPLVGLAFASRDEERVYLREAVREERALMALGEALGSCADPRYLARTTQRASISEFFRQVEELAEQAEKLADTARTLTSRRFDEPNSPISWQEAQRLVQQAEAAWANTRRIQRVVRNTVVPLKEWESAEES